MRPALVPRQVPRNVLLKYWYVTVPVATTSIDVRSHLFFGSDDVRQWSLRKMLCLPPEHHLVCIFLGLVGHHSEKCRLIYPHHIII